MLAHLDKPAKVCYNKSMKQNSSPLSPIGIIGALFLLGLLFFKWLPEWTWQAKAPEITINEYIFETKPTWQGGVATVSSSYPPDIYIRVRPDEAADERAKLTVLVNDKEVSDNCSYSSKYFCYKIEDDVVKDGNKYEIVAKNVAGEKRVTVNVKINANTKSETTTETTPAASPESTPTSSEPKTNNSSSDSASSSSSGNSNTTPYVKSTTCLHYEAGRCWDELEDEMYSSGLYDHSYGYRGASFMTPDDCDSRCQDILEDAYEEGYYDF